MEDKIIEIRILINTAVFLIIGAILALGIGVLIGWLVGKAVFG